MADTRTHIGSLPIPDIISALQAVGNITCIEGESLDKHTSLRVGGPAALYIYPNEIQGLQSAVQYLLKNKLEWFVIGYGTNLLVSDDGYDGVVIDLKRLVREVSFEGTEVTVSAGVWMNDVIRSAAGRGLSGWGKLAGIPGSLGGWLYMNAGAFRSSISEHLESVTVLDRQGNLLTLTKDEVGFGYRSAPALSDKIILSARFVLLSESPQNAIAEVEATIQERYRRNVMTLPSAGSVFKNPEGKFAAQLIESIGGKGMREGGVEISPNHANFIVNERGGNAGDIIRLISKVRQLVRERHGVELTLEVRTIGFRGAI